MTIEKQFDVYLKQLQTRKRKPVKGATLAAYQSYWHNWIHPNIGQLETAAVENGVMKSLVSLMCEAGLSPATISAVTNCVKGIVASAQDENGNQLYPRTWNAEFIDAPIVDPKALNTPVIEAQAVSDAISRAAGQYGPLIALLAGSGLRISEVVALKVGFQTDSSYWDARQSKLVIQKALYKGEEQLPKTAAGVREVDLDPALNDYLMDFFGVAVDIMGQRMPGDYLFQAERQEGRPLSVNTAYDVKDKLGMPGFHSLRRFRCTHLENAGVPRGLAMYWTGHAGKDVHDRYVKLDKNIQARKEWAKRAGLGFVLPGATIQPEEEVTLIA